MATTVKKPQQELKKVESSKTTKGVEKDIKPFQAFISKFMNDWSFNLAGALAYNFLLSTVPILIAMLAILGFVLGAIGQKTLTITNSISGAFPKQLNVSSIVTGVQNNLTHSAGILAFISVISAIIFGSRLFVVIEGMFCIVYHVRPRKLIPQNIMAILMLLAFIVYVPLAFLASSIPTFVFSLIKNAPGLSFLSVIGGIVVSIVVSFGLFLLIYIVVPNQSITWKHSWLGALIAAIALQVYLSLFPLYVRYALSNTAGVVGATVILIVFFYYFAIILFLGAEVNAFFSERVQPLPNDLATFVSTMAGRINKDRPNVEADHVNAQPTDQADDAHIGEARQGRGQGRGRGRERGQAHTSRGRNKHQPVLASQSIAEEYVEATAKAKENASKGPSKTVTLIEILAGSALTLLIEWLQIRRRAR